MHLSNNAFQSAGWKTVFIVNLGQRAVLLRFILLLISGFISGLLTTGAIADESATAAQLIIDAEWLQQHLDDENLLIVDAREPERYEAGHITGAVNLPVEKTFRQSDTGSKVASLQMIQRLFRQVGIRHDQTVVVYDDDEYINAGRLFWVLEVFRHQHVKLLNGGYHDWQRRKFPVSKQTPAITPSEFVAGIEPERLAAKLDILLALEDSSKQLVDARKEEDYRGIKSKSSRYGHIPGAVNIPVDRALSIHDNSKLIKPLSSLRQIYSGIPKDKKIYLYCNRGKEASLSYTILRQLGYDVAHYDGSWIEWGNNNDLPIVGSKPVLK